MNWAYALIIVLLLGGYFLLHFLHVRHTRRMEELINEEKTSPDEASASDMTPLSEVTREMVQHPDGCDSDKPDGE